MTFANARLAECALYGRLGAGYPAPYRHRALGAVKVVLDVQVVFHLAVEGKHIGVGPLIVAPAAQSSKSSDRPRCIA